MNSFIFQHINNQKQLSMGWISMSRHCLQILWTYSRAQTHQKWFSDWKVIKKISVSNLHLADFQYTLDWSWCVSCWPSHSDVWKLVSPCSMIIYNIIWISKFYARTGGIISVGSISISFWFLNSKKSWWWKKVCVHEYWGGGGLF